MKYILLLILGLSGVVNANDICPKNASKIEPGHKWEESAFSKEAAMASLKKLTSVVENGDEIGTYDLPNSITLLEGYILKRDAVKAMEREGTPEGIKEFYKSGFCEFLNGAAIYE